MTKQEYVNKIKALIVLASGELETEDFREVLNYVHENINNLLDDLDESDLDDEIDEDEDDDEDDDEDEEYDESHTQDDLIDEV